MKPYRAVQQALSAFAILLSPLGGVVSTNALAANFPPPKTPDLLRQLASLAPDDCSAPYDSVPTFDVDHTEELLFESIENHVVDRLNKPTLAGASEAESRARSALREVEQWSSEINKKWPSDDRFHFEVLPLHPAIVVRMDYRGHAKVALFGIFHRGEYAIDAGIKWHNVGFVDPSNRASGIDIFPLHRGPSGRARFLARVISSGCAGSIGEAYYGYEWSPELGDGEDQIIKIEGAEGLDDTASQQVGRLRISGNTIQLPYCFFSAVDTWDNPTLCAADSFDVSGDVPRFIRRVYNSPDLVVVNNAIHHAQARDYAALRGYCATEAVARKLVREVPPFLFPDDLKKVKVSPTHETVVFEEGPVHFNLIKRRGEWLLESFHIGHDR